MASTVHPTDTMANGGWGSRQHLIAILTCCNPPKAVARRNPAVTLCPLHTFQQPSREDCTPSELAHHHAGKGPTGSRNAFSQGERIR
eukprot:3794865-Amphidinium_carterae.1